MFGMPLLLRDVTVLGYISSSVCGVCRLMGVASMGAKLAKKNQPLVCHMA